MLRASSETASVARDLRVERKIFPDVCISCFVVLVFDISLADCRSLLPMCLCALCTCTCICTCTCTCTCICICFWSASHHTNTNTNTNKTHTLHSNTNTTTPTHQHPKKEEEKEKEKEKEKREREKERKEREKKERERERERREEREREKRRREENERRNERTKRKRKEKEKEEREKQITVTAGPFWGIISNYSYRRASAGELILHYITVGPSPGIRNVILFARMVLVSQRRQTVRDTRCKKSWDQLEKYGFTQSMLLEASKREKKEPSRGKIQGNVLLARGRLGIPGCVNERAGGKRVCG